MRFCPDILVCQMHRNHPPLRRMGESTVVAPPSAAVPRAAQLAHSSSLLRCDLDSCYSSCSEDTHSSLSREASDTLSGDVAFLSIQDRADDSPSLHEFGVNLGYSPEQVEIAIEALGPLANQDTLLSELVRGGKADTPRAVAAPVNLRAIVIDGSNIAITHGRKEVFSCTGIRECVQFFVNRGHSDVLVFIPQYRKESPRADCPITDQHILASLDKQGRIVWTPSRRLHGRRIVCHDDRYILKSAWDKDGVVVSNDEFRELARECPQYKYIAEHRLLMYSFVDGKFMPPDDPLGRRGPTLDQFLSRSAHLNAQLCPYARKCTYGNKCKYFHPERPNGVHLSVTQRMLSDKGKAFGSDEPPGKEPLARTFSLDVNCKLGENTGAGVRKMSAIPSHVQWPHQSLSRNRSVPLQDSSRAPAPAPVVAGAGNSLTTLFPSTNHLFAPNAAVWGQSELSVGPVVPVSIPESGRLRLKYHLSNLFPEMAVSAVMEAHPDEYDPRKLCEKILELQKGFDQNEFALDDKSSLCTY